MGMNEDENDEPELRFPCPRCVHRRCHNIWASSDTDPVTELHLNLRYACFGTLRLYAYAYTGLIIQAYPIELDSQGRPLLPLYCQLMHMSGGECGSVCPYL